MRFLVGLVMGLTVIVPVQAQLPTVPGFPTGGQVPQAVPATVDSVLQAINPNCVAARVIDNACANGTLSILTYWAPTHWVEVTGKTNVAVVEGQTPLQVLGGLGAPNPLISGGGASTSGGAGDAQTNKHFKEVRVYEMPTSLSQTSCGICDGHSAAAFQLNYTSDDDNIWRTQSSVPIPGLTGAGPPSPTDFGVWGPIYPRHGFVIHGSEVVAAAHAAARGMHIANLPLETHPTPFLRDIETPSSVPPTCFQVAHPRQSQCLPVGASPIYFETFRLEPEGKYVFIHWSLKACCLDQGTARACEASSGGGTENFCLSGVSPLGFVAGAIPFK